MVVLLENVLIGGTLENMSIVPLMMGGTLENMSIVLLMVGGTLENMSIVRLMVTDYVQWTQLYLIILSELLVQGSLMTYLHPIYLR